MRSLYKFLSIVILTISLVFVFIFGGVSLVEGYNIINPYIDTEFAENYTPEKFDQINIKNTKDEVINLIGTPLFIHKDSVNNEEIYTYTNDGYFRKTKKIGFSVSDYAWYRSSIHFGNKGQIIKIDKGWSYD